MKRIQIQQYQEPRANQLGHPNATMIRQYTEKQRESARTRAKIWSKANCERVRANQKAWAAANPERVRANQKAWYAANRKRLLAKAKAWAVANPERKRANRKAWYAANPERFRRSSKDWNEANRERKRATNKAWCEKNRERKRANSKAWAVANPERVRTRQKAWTNLNYATNPNFKIRVNYSCLIKNVLKKDCGKKAFKTMRLLDCDIPYLRAWLEIQFRPGMTWENHGPIWHIDHKKPCSKFDLTDPLEQRRCFHWMNLQPLFAFENLSKGAKWEPEAA